MSYLHGGSRCCQTGNMTSVALQDSSQASMEDNIPVKMKGARPTLSSERLILRPFIPEDGKNVEKYAGHPDIAATTIRIPHPYPEGEGERWIATHQTEWESGRALVLALTLKDSDGNNGVIGTVGCDFEWQHDSAQLGFWMGVPFQNKGYVTEAVWEVINYCFGELGVNCVHGEFFSGNAASRKVMEKCGMKFEGIMRNRVKKGSHYEDIGSCSVLRSEWEASVKTGQAS